jgi:hypothetical protein
MARPYAVPSVLLALVLVLLAEVAVGDRHTGRTPIYGVATLRAHLAHDPRHWVGRTLLVRGEIVPCLAMPSADNGRCAALAPSAWQPPSPTPWRTAVDPLPVVHAGLDPFLTRLRQVPFLGALVPSPQVVQWGVTATYRVTLRASSHSICGTGVCYEALLLDAAP